MKAAHVADLDLNVPDSTGVEIIAIYAKKPPEYAVYRTSQRVLVHFADDITKRDEQRKALAQLSPLRGEINGLIDGWRSVSRTKRFLGIWPEMGPKIRAKAERYDRRVADALIVGLEGDLTGAGALLEAIKEDIVAERIGWSRFEYLLMAFFMASLLTLLLIAVALLDEHGRCSLGRMLCFPHAWDLWRGGGAGAFGAFFSIALAIRGRTILPDFYRTSNLMDAALRIVIGTMAGVILVALIDAKFVRFALGDSSVGVYDALHIFIVGFVAGFTERLVPDLLAKAEAKTGEPPIIRKPEPNLDRNAISPAKGEEKADKEGTAAGASAEALGADADADACVAEIDLDDEEVTGDQDLPAASGGVAKAEELVP